MATLADLQDARTGLETSRRIFVDAIHPRELARAVLAEAKRTGTPAAIAAADTALGIAEGAFATARADEAQKKTHLSGLIAEWLEDHDQEGDLRRLSAANPIVLFPVRVETRFKLDPNGNKLLVRIYPDEIFINIHERALTAEERAAGEAYWTSDPEHPTEQDRWQRLVSKFPVPRAAYIARAMAPLEDGGDPVDAVGLRPGVWTRPGEVVLPDRWLVTLYPRGQTPRTVPGRPVREPLAVTLDPSSTEADLTPADANGFKIESDLAWTTDFQKAVAAGMALEIDLQGDEAKVDGSGGFDRVIVLGVKTSMSANDTAVHLERLFDAQHYTNGMGFLRQGAPTNNTVDHPVSAGPPDRTGEVSFAIERAHPPGPLDAPTHDDSIDPGERFAFDLMAQAFGLANGVFRNLRDGMSREQFDAEGMSWALWPTTLGYFMDQLMAPVFSPVAIERARAYFIRHVRGRGNFPAFRVEEVPYGVLPVLSLANWGLRDEFPEASLESSMLDTLRRLRQIWRRVGQGPTIAQIIASLSPSPAPATPTAPESPLLAVLAQDASSRSMRVRSAQGITTLANTAMKFRQDPVRMMVANSQAARKLMADVGHPEWNPRITQLTYDDQSHPFSGPLVASETDDPKTYLPALGNLSLDQLQALDTAGKPLLYQLVRSALMNEYIRIARQVAPSNPTLVRVRNERELWNVKSAQQPETTVFDAFRESAGGSDTIGGKVTKSPERTFYLQALERIMSLPIDELERLMTETLDLCSHRLDGWISALAARRLLVMRNDQARDPFGRQGSYLGGYAFLHDVRPRQRTTRPTDVGAAEVQEANGGFIHAPSLAHARAAAVLRSGYMAHRREDPEKYALNVSSERARRARELLDEVRDGVSLGAALGFRFERRVRETQLPVGARPLGQFVQRLRELYPLVANKNGEPVDPAVAVETIAAQNVVDGQVLLRAFNGEPAPIPFDTDARLPRKTTTEYALLKAQLDRLTELFDAVSDLLTAESMFQLVQGNVIGAQAAADALAAGARPPEIEIARSPRTGVAVTHRVALVFQGTTPPALPADWPAAVGARAAAEPFLNGWLGQLLGDPQRIVTRVDYRDGDQDHSVEVSLGMLNIGPLDFLALARTSTETTPGSALDRRILAAMPAVSGTDFKVTYGRAEVPKVSFTQALALARAVASLFPGARALQARDLQTPNDANTAPGGSGDAAELAARARAARTALAGARAALAAAATEGQRRAALITAAQFAGELYPAAVPEAAAVASALAELDRRLSRAETIAPGAGTAVLTLEQSTQLLGAVFGDDFVALAVLGAVPRSTELGRSLAARASLLAGMADAPAQLLQQTARVREPLARWRKLGLYAGALGAARPRLDVAQLPHVEGATWAGGPFGAAPPERGRVSLLMLSPAGAPALDTTSPWRGLLLDDWVEVIPSAVESTGLSFHFDGPNAEAGNAILIAVPSRALTSSGASQWSFAELLATAEETFDLIELRAIDPDVLGLGQLLPAIYLPANLNSVTPSSPMQGSLENDVRIVEG